MKKLLSILLALVMVFSLTVPAFADGPDGPPDIPAPDDYYDDYYDDDYDYDAWVKEYWAELCEEYPQETTQFVAEVETWFSTGSSYYSYLYDSFDEFCASRSCVEDAYTDLFWDWMSDYEAEQARKDFITDRGGVPGRINVMLNGKYVTFSDAAPEVADGRTMVPFRAIFETLGAEVSYEDGKIHADLGNTALDLTIGSDTMTKTVDGSAETVKMDCAPYAKGGRTYVPVRFIGEALGLDVQWDDYYQSAVITDLDALAAEIDKDFTIYNKQVAASQSTLTDKTQKAVGSGRADVTLFDTLNGDKTGKATYSYDLAASTAGASGKIEYDFSELWELIEGYIPMPLDDGTDDYYPDYTEQYTQALEMIKSLMKGSMEVRVDLEKGKAYLSMPGLFEAMGDYMEESGVQLPKDAWLSVSLGDSDELDEMIGSLDKVTTMGGLLTDIGSSGYYAAKNYDNILEMAELFGKMYGDAKFKRQGSSYVMTLTKEDLREIMLDLVEDEASVDESLNTLSKFDFTMTFYDNGGMDVSYQIRGALSTSEINLGDSIDLSVKGSARSGRSESTMELHIKNVLKATIKLQETVTETDKAPETTPPSDVLVLPIDGELPGSTVTSPDGPTQVQP